MPVSVLHLSRRVESSPFKRQPRISTSMGGSFQAESESCEGPHPGLVSFTKELQVSSGPSSSPVNRENVGDN